MQPAVVSKLHQLGIRQHPAGVFCSNGPRGGEPGNFANGHVEPIGLKLFLKRQIVLQQRRSTFDQMSDGIAVQRCTRHGYIQKSDWRACWVNILARPATFSMGGWSGPICAWSESSSGLVVHEVLNVLGEGDELGNLGDDRLGGNHHAGDASRVL